MPTTLQNFYKSTVSIDWSVGTGNFYVTTKPTPTAGWLVLSPNNATLREIVQYTATGTDGNGDFVTLSARGVGGTTEQVHGQGEPIRMNITAEHWEQFKDDTQDSLDVMTGNITDIATDLANISITAGNVKASDVVYGNTKLSVAPVSLADPIAFGANDPKLTTSSGSALTGTTNKIVDTLDTDGTGLVQRATAVNGHVFGDGSDGNVTISSNTTLTRDMFYNNLTVDATFTLTTANYRVYVKGTLTVNGTIDNSGGAGGAGSAGAIGSNAGGSGGTAGAATAAGTLLANIAGTAGGRGGEQALPVAVNGGGGGGSGASGGIVAIYAYSIVISATGVISSRGGAGGNGGNGANGGSVPNSGIAGGIGSAGTAGISASPSLGSSGTAHAGSSGNGGAGGNDSTNTFLAGAGGTSGAAGTATLTKSLPHSVTQAQNLLDLVTGTPLKSSASAAAGAGGGGGGTGTGANNSGSAGGGGGGYGGSGGVLVLVYHTLTNSGSLSVAGGAGGTKGNAGTGGTNLGSNGQDGLAGASGVTYSIQI